MSAEIERALQTSRLVVGAVVLELVVFMAVAALLAPVPEEPPVAPSVLKIGGLLAAMVMWTVGDTIPRVWATRLGSVRPSSFVTVTIVRAAVFDTVGTVGIVAFFFTHDYNCMIPAAFAIALLLLKFPRRAGVPDASEE
jgi:hypothetical protein